MGAALVFIITAIIFITNFIDNNTVVIPINGGEYSEGSIGQPTFINPVLSPNNGADSDLSSLMFATVKDMSDDIQSSEDKLTYNVRIKGDIFWQDNQPITSDDLIFTIRAIQDPDVNSPLASSWKGVKVQRISEREVQITLPTAYSFFDNILANLKPIPKHIFENIPFANIRLSDYNLEPIGSGPFKFSTFEKRKDGFITTYTLEKNDKAFSRNPYINTFTMKFYSTEDDLVKAFNSGDIDGMSLTTADDISKISIPHDLMQIQMPRYYAVFFNGNNNPLLKDLNIRTALNAATDRNQVTKDVFNDLAYPINGPALDNASNTQEFSIDKANQILDSLGWVKNNDGTRTMTDKTGTKNLEFTLTVYPSPFLIKTAQILQNQWSQAGIKISIDTPSIDDFTDIIKSRNYDMLLFGNIYGENLDPYSFWYSNQKFYPGLNLSLYDNKNADSVIDQIRTTFDENNRKNEMEKLQSIITSDQPAIFLYSPYYIYATNKVLKGFDEKYLPLPNDRFNNIQNWYVKSSRTFKK